MGKDENQSDSRSWKLGKQNKSGESRLELEPLEEEPKKKRVSPPKPDPRNRESIVDSKPAPKVSNEEEDDRPIVPLGRAVDDKKKKKKVPLTPERIIKHPVTIIVGTALICWFLLSTFWPSLDTLEEDNYYLYDAEIPGSAVVAYFVDIDSSSPIKGEPISYNEPLGIREGRFLLVVGEVMEYVGQARKNKGATIKNSGIPTLAGIDTIPIPSAPKDDLERFVLESQHTEMLESIRDMSIRIENAVFEGKVDAQDLINSGKYLQIQGKSLLDTTLESQIMRDALNVKGAVMTKATTQMMPFSEVEPVVSTVLHPEVAKNVILVHNRYF